MPYKRLIIIILVACIFPLNLLHAFETDSLEFKDRVYKKNIKSVRMHLLDWEVSYPILDMYSDVPLLFSFDQLESEPVDYYYTVIHCTHDWKASDIMFFEYAEGFEENELYEYEESQSTFVPYTHYTLTIPNNDLSLTKSGNYLLVVYTNDDEIDVVCTKRFMAYEQELEIEGRVNASAQSDYNKECQKLDFRINKGSYNIYDVHNDLKIVIMQNYNWNNIVTDLTPSFLDNEVFVYEWEDKALFNAGNESRYFSFNNLEIYSEYVSNIEFKKPYYHISLYPAKPRIFEPYSSYEDINGHYVISTKRFANNDFPEVQSEYGMVKFQLEYNVPVSNTDIYLFGELTNYEISDEYMLKYNLETRSYEKLMFLKQGYYNYSYVLVNNEEGVKPDFNFFEGSFFETENDYLLFIYHRDPSESYDKLVSYTHFNSRNN